MVSMRKTNIKVVPVTAEIDGKRVVVGSAELVSSEVDTTASVRIDLDAPEGLNMATMLNRGIYDAISVSSDNADLINKVAESNKQYKKDKPDDGTAGNE